MAKYNRPKTHQDISDETPRQKDTAPKLNVLPITPTALHDNDVSDSVRDKGTARKLYWPPHYGECAD